MYQSFVGGRGMGSIGQPGTLVYTPNLGPVGSGPTYFPGDVEQDAAALVFLDFMSNVADANRNISRGSQGADIANVGGAWDPAFRASTARFQAAKGLTADTWIGPKTRAALAAAVAFQNLNPGKLPPPPPPGVIPVDPGRVPAQPAVIPGLRPVAAGDSDDTLLYAGLGVGALALLGVGWYALK